ncbi:MAG: hypothetical protein QM800_07770 [Paludibacter sp.]
MQNEYGQLLGSFASMLVLIQVVSVTMYFCATAKNGSRINGAGEVGTFSLFRRANPAL